MSMSIDQITDVMSNKAMDLSRSLQNVVSRSDISDPSVMSQVQYFTHQLYSTIGLQSAILDVYKKINQVIIQRI
ncbi:EscF/YscF/HrpA family type III secretion system needle major subunit [Mycoavidus sp. HKI]|uniref:EscF/YscF/HrpA family type III secretion system needle major subunit n=1 Tax=Mycoavidus sp. HKI TaxID=2840467 RepID=UPI001CBA9B99|nr:EscF/YscF/HrpA family type III secretion system needle major subunit [Mycoavidus sp. HKI]UAW64280.1 EscF/YscF/HrpA family type III secretion system needle major subunit [Mycoavidus sp. HKI]